MDFFLAYLFYIWSWPATGKVDSVSLNSRFINNTVKSFVICLNCLDFNVAYRREFSALKNDCKQ